MLQEINTYEDAVSYILEVPKFAKKNTIEQSSAFYEFLNMPGKGAKIVHVAGTNGKGSVCAYLQSILFEANVRTGMFTSPHLIDIRERFQVNKEMIEEESFLQVFGQVYEAVIMFNKKNHWLEMDENKKIIRLDYHPTFFEFLFFMAMIWFQEQKTEVIILETGLGGRLDTTNIIKEPAVTILTEIGFDHMEYLGNTLSLIAKEKAGIMKRNVPLIYIEQKEECEAVIEAQAKKLDIKVRKVSKIDDKSLRFHNKIIDFSYESRYYGCIEIKLSTVARYQVYNASLAIATIEELFQGKDYFKQAIIVGLQKAVWAGRMEEILPNVFIDGAHNEDGINVFLKTVRNDGTTGKRFLLFSAVGDKQYQAMLSKLMESGLFQRTLVAPINNGRSLEKEDFEELKNTGLLVEIFDGAESGFHALRKVQKPDDKIYIVGSLYLVGQMKNYIQENLK